MGRKPSYVGTNSKRVERNTDMVDRSPDTRAPDGPTNSEFYLMLTGDTE